MKKIHKALVVLQKFAASLAVATEAGIKVLSYWK